MKHLGQKCVTKGITFFEYRKEKYGEEQALKQAEIDKQKRSESHKGKIWINNNIIEKAIEVYDLENFLNQGYTRGRLKTLDFRNKKYK